MNYRNWPRVDTKWCVRQILGSMYLFEYHHCTSPLCFSVSDIKTGCFISWWWTWVIRKNNLFWVQEKCQLPLSTRCKHRRKRLEWLVCLSVCLSVCQHLIRISFSIFLHLPIYVLGSNLDWFERESLIWCSLSGIMPYYVWVFLMPKKSSELYFMNNVKIAFLS